MHPNDSPRAIRTSVALSRHDHVRYIRVRGDGAATALARVVPRRLYVRDGQLLPTLLLREDGRIFADCMVGADEDDFFLLCEGPSGHELVTWLRAHCDGVDDVEFVDESAARSLVGLDGPYAWELLAGWAGQEVVGLPYLTFFHLDDVLCCRTGKTGEYGYLLSTPSSERDRLEGTLRELGEAFDVGEAGLAELDQCALENWFFNIRREGRADVGPLEAQLQWRISRDRTFVGSDALREHRLGGVRRRATTILGRDLLVVGDRVTLADTPVGEVVNAGFCEARDEWVGLALLDVEVALPGVGGLRVGEAGHEARSVTPPVLDNRSLYVNPQVHSYASRHEDAFPPLVRR